MFLYKQALSKAFGLDQLKQYQILVAIPRPNHIP